MTPLELVQSHYVFPFETILPQQIETVNDLAPLWNAGHLLDVGVGKTFTSTACALYQKITNGHQTVILMPPVLMKQWVRWLDSIKTVDGRKLSVTAYRGTPAQRAKLSLDSDFVLVGVQMFRKEQIKFHQYFRDRKYTLIIEEATIIAGVDSKQHEYAYDFSIGHPVMALSGTPIGVPLHGYSITKFTAPGTYRSYQHFLNSHVESMDFFGLPDVYCELPMLKENLKKNSKRFLFEDVHKDTQTPLITRIDYELDPKHHKLYEKLSEEQILLLPDGGKIDATTANKLLHALGQIVVNQSHFSGVSGDSSSALELIKQKMSELGVGKSAEHGNKKLVVFTHYRLTSAAVTEYFKKSHKAVSIYGDDSPAQKDRNRDTFVNDPECRMIVIQQRSGGFGLDGLQHVCHHALFIEPCPNAAVLTQCVGRLKRTGQKAQVVIWLAVAEGTLQVRGFKNLLKSDDLVNQVIRNAYELRKIIFGQ